MESIIIQVPEELKRDFQIKTILKGTNMTAVLTEKIKEYMKEE